MEAFVIVATKGRPSETFTLLDAMARQTQAARLILVIGAGPADIHGLDSHPLVKSGRAITLTAKAPGLTRQRNTGLDYLKTHGLFDLPAEGPAPGRFYCVFFDDDFRPADTWLEQAAVRFAQDEKVAGLTGHVLADGVLCGGLTEALAAEHISGARPPMAHWSSGASEKPVEGLYGCNMAFADFVVKAFRFDEKLPLYGWQEDSDYSGQALTVGALLYSPNLKGVHLGVRGARVSGFKFGYSQIANPLYLANKGTLTRGKALKLIVKNMLANHVRVIWPEPWIDRFGRVRGNWTAFGDLLVGKLSPDRRV